MVIDDNPAIRKILRNILEFDRDWIVCGEGVDGRDGVEKAKALSPDLIVLDVSMPVMNGLEAARILHQIMPNVPVILCSLHRPDVGDGSKGRGHSSVRRQKTCRL
jgi:chemotaxis response regulator CheB